MKAYLMRKIFTISFLQHTKFTFFYSISICLQCLSYRITTTLSFIQRSITTSTDNDSRYRCFIIFLLVSFLLIFFFLHSIYKLKLFNFIQKIFIFIAYNIRNEYTHTLQLTTTLEADDTHVLKKWVIVQKKSRQNLCLVMFTHIAKCVWVVYIWIMKNAKWRKQYYFTE